MFVIVVYQRELIKLKILISDISVNPERRKAEPKQVEKLVKSMAVLGLISPITIDKKHILIAGLHRLEAAKLLGWEKIECTVSNLDGLQAELAEIDENVVRSNLSPAERGDLLMRRKEIYETIHPESRATYNGGQFRGNQHQNVVAAPSAATTKSFVQDTSEQTGMSPRTVRQYIQTAKNLTPEARAIIGDTDTKLGPKAALKLSRLPPEQQKEAASLLASKKIRSINEYHPEQQEKPAEQDAAVENPQEAPDEAEPDKHTSPASETVRGTALFREIVADLKNADKDFSCTPDSFLAEIASFVQTFQKELDWYNMPYYEAVYPALTPEQFRDFRRQMDAICTAVQNLIHHVEANVK